MISRLVTVDLILSTSLRLQKSMLCPITEEQLAFYGAIRELLNGWARKIEGRGLAVQLETIAEGALQVYLAGTEVPGKTWINDLTNIGNQLIERAREIELLALNRSVFLPDVPRQEEMANALKEGEAVSFTDAATTITGDTNVTRAKPRFKKFLQWVRDDWVEEPEAEAWRLLNDILLEEKQVTVSAIRLLTDRCYPHFKALAPF